MPHAQMNNPNRRTRRNIGAAYILLMSNIMKCELTLSYIVESTPKESWNVELIFVYVAYVRWHPQRFGCMIHAVAIFVLGCSVWLPQFMSLQGGQVQTDFETIGPGTDNGFTMRQTRQLPHAPTNLGAPQWEQRNWLVLNCWFFNVAITDHAR